MMKHPYKTHKITISIRSPGNLSNDPWPRGFYHKSLQKAWPTRTQLENPKSQGKLYKLPCCTCEWTCSLDTDSFPDWSRGKPCQEHLLGWHWADWADWAQTPSNGLWIACLLAPINTVVLPPADLFYRFSFPRYLLKTLFTTKALEFHFQP